MTNLTTQLQQEVRKEFEKKVNELKNSDYENEKPEEFGYRFLDDDRDEIHTVPDWGNVQAFLDQTVEKIVERVGEESAESAARSELISKIQKWFRNRVKKLKEI